jgi:hypothetical protein
MNNVTVCFKNELNNRDQFLEIEYKNSNNLRNDIINAN